MEYANEPSLPGTFGFDLFPNPVASGNRLIIESSAQGIVTIYDAMGRSLLTQHVSRNVSISTDRFPAGAYFAILQPENGIAPSRKTFVVVH